MAIQEVSCQRRADFVLEASVAIGGGHLARCAALSETLVNLGWCTSIVTHEDPAAILPRAVRAFSERRRGSAPDGERALAVFDGYGIDAELERSWALAAPRRVVIDDLANRLHEAEVLVDPTPGRRADDYTPFLSESATILTGANYVLLRSRWRALRLQRQANLSEQVRTVVISMGATDPDNATSKVLNAVLAAVPNAQVFVILGKAAPHLMALRVSFSSEAEILVDPDDYDERIANADLVVGSAGSSVFERACVGVPSIACITASNQRKLGASLAKLGVAEVLGSHEWRDTDTLKRRILTLVSEPTRRQRLSVRGREIVDGRGALRVTAAAIGREAWGQERISFRLFERSDTEWLLRLQQQPETRVFARTPEVPTHAEHMAYVEAILASDSRVLLLIESGERLLGYVRLDFGVVGSAEVSIAIDPSFHRMGVGRIALNLVRRFAPGLRLRAFVKAGNTVSSALFRRAGYRIVDQDPNGLWFESKPL